MHTFSLNTKIISIHAPLAGRDRSYRGNNPQCGNFNPRAPCGARHKRKCIVFRASKFQSTRPLRGATARVSIAVQALTISIHAPLAGRDASLASMSSLTSYFNPRAPCGARPARSACPATPSSISIHAPLAGRDLRGLCPVQTLYHFNPRAPCGARRAAAVVAMQLIRHFNPRAPCGARRPTAAQPD